MKKKILIGSIFVLVLILLMPSIPAIQHKTVEEGFKQDLQEKLEAITVDDLKEMEELDGIRHPILYAIVISIANFRFSRCYFYARILDELMVNPNNPILPQNPIIFYILLLRLGALAGRTNANLLYWDYASDWLGWNWDIF